MPSHRRLTPCQLRTGSSVGSYARYSTLPCPNCSCARSVVLPEAYTTCASFAGTSCDATSGSDTLTGTARCPGSAVGQPGGSNDVLAVMVVTPFNVPGRSPAGKAPRV